ncbi:C-type lectin domain family 4 member F-like isoform X2 [Mercenaria mercenaria]|nr:C-type lectin domain family 4 member F-like isoform X2 [Mercenaria mercenaria]
MTFVTPTLILLLMTCAWNVEVNALLKRRLNTLETRVNSIEMRVNTDNELTRSTLTAMRQDVQAINTSIIILEDQACVCSNVRDENDGTIKQNLGQSVVVSQQSKTLINKGFVDEKKWVRKKVKIIEKEMHKVINQVGNNNDMIAETVTRMQDKENDLDRKLNEAISEVMTNCSSEIINQVGINNDMTAETVTRMHVLVDKLDRKLDETIFDVMTKYRAEIRKRDEKIDVQQVEINDLKQMVDKMKEVLENLPCTDGWTKFQSFCYLYINENKTYVSARETCLKLGASVADIQSLSENEFVYKLCGNNGHTWNQNWNEGNVWIGLSDGETEGVWISDRTREKSTYM